MTAAGVVSVALEKVQVAVLAERLDELLDELERRGIEGAGTPSLDADERPLDEPINEAFRAGTLSLGWDGEDERSSSRPGSRPRTRRPRTRTLDDRRRRRGRPGPAPRPARPPMAARAFVGRALPRRRAPAGRRARCAASRSTRRATSARGATATAS